MPQLRRRTGTEDIRVLERQFNKLSREHEPGDLTLPLRDLVVDQLRSDYPREEVLGALDDFRYALRDTDREDLEDDVIDVMGFMTGWCSPHMKIGDEEVSQAQGNTDTSRTPQQQKLSQSSVELTDSARQSFQMLADRTVALQESNLRLTQSFFQNWIEQVQSQAQGIREATQGLQEQGRRQREAFETLSQEATNAYSEFLDSALSFYQETLSTATQVAQGNMQQAAQATQQSMQAGVQAASQAGQQAMEAANQAGQQGAQAANQSAQESAQAGEQVAQEANQAAQDTESSNRRRRGSRNQSSS